jgi:hypothetical protein
MAGNKIYSPGRTRDARSLYVKKKLKTFASSTTYRFSGTNTSSIPSALFFVGNWPNSRQMSPYILINLSGGPFCHPMGTHHAILNKQTLRMQYSGPVLYILDSPSIHQYVHIYLPHRTGPIFRSWQSPNWSTNSSPLGLRRPKFQ